MACEVGSTCSSIADLLPSTCPTGAGHCDIGCLIDGCFGEGCKPGCGYNCRDSCSGCTNACQAACGSYVPTCDSCQLACSGGCSGTCQTVCSYGCRSVAHTDAYNELSSISDLIASVDGNALINLITEEINRRSLTLTGMGNANVGTTVLASTMTNARTNLSRMNKTVNAASGKATKTLFESYVTAVRELYNVLVAQP